MHHLCRPPKDTFDVRRWDGEEWVYDDGKPGLAFVGLQRDGMGGSFPKAWATACSSECPTMACIFWDAMSRGARSYGGCTGGAVAPLPEMAADDRYQLLTMLV